jgi:hypothetical protein
LKKFLQLLLQKRVGIPIPITSCDVEKSFLKYNSTLFNRRESFANFVNLKSVLIFNLNIQRFDYLMFFQLLACISKKTCLF